MKLLMTAAKAAATRVMKMLRKRIDRPYWEFAIAPKQRIKCAQRQRPAQRALSLLNLCNRLFKMQLLIHTHTTPTQPNARSNNKLTTDHQPSGAGCLFAMYTSKAYNNQPLIWVGP